MNIQNGTISWSHFFLAWKILQKGKDTKPNNNTNKGPSPTTQHQKTETKQNNANQPTPSLEETTKSISMINRQDRGQWGWNKQTQPKGHILLVCSIVRLFRNPTQLPPGIREKEIRNIHQNNFTSPIHCISRSTHNLQKVLAVSFKTSLKTCNVEAIS